MAGSSFGSGSNCCKSDVGVPDQFPAGLKVLVVDDDVTCLRILEQMLRRCLYNVTTCSQATVALNLLRERKGFFDVVLSDVHMPDMDGFRLLEFVGLEMDLPVIMMSADGRTNLVLRGIKHGACDYLIKPIREEELKNIWQHVIRKKWSGNKEHEHSGSLDDDCQKRGGDDTEYASSVNEGADGMLRSHKKKRDVKEEDDCELENEDPGASKKPRVVWSVELHQQFVSAVNQLGIDKAVPKRILELMNVPGLTRENVASHLQKFRLYLKRLSGVSQQQGGSPNSFCGSIEQNPKLGSYGRYDIQALAASGHIPPQTLAALHAELLGRPTGNVGLTALDQPPLLQVSKIPVDDNVTYGQPIMKFPSNITKPIPQVIDDAHSGFGAWPSSNSLVSNLGGTNVLMGILQNQQQQKHSITVQPSCLVVPTQSSVNFQAGNSGASINQTTNFNRGSIIDYNLLLPQPDGSSYSVRQTSEGDIRTTGCSVNTLANSGAAGRQLGSLADDNTGEKQICFGKSGQMLDQGPLRNLGFVGKGISIPSRFAVYEVESPTSTSSNHGKVFGDNNSGRKVKQEPNIDLIENSKVRIPMTQHYSQNDLMGVFSFPE